MFALIMAGGTGTRFWPKSRQKYPKQFLRMFGERTLIQNTFDRLHDLIPDDHIFVVSTEEYKEEIENQLSSLPRENIIIEPQGKNTAPCIGLSSIFLERIDPDGVMVVLPADHLILDTAMFHNTLSVGAKVAKESDSLMTIGIEPNFPATGYGYIQFKKELEIIDGVKLLKVKTFAEKPNRATAKRFIKSGDFLWNSGIFIWKVKAILNEIEEHLPHLYDGLLEIRKHLNSRQQTKTINRVYRQIKSVSIDYGIMEHSENVKVLKGTFRWNDLGSWDEVYKLHDKDADDNVSLGEHIIKDSKGCFIDAPGKFVGLLGVEDLIVVDTKDAILVCKRDRAQDVKDLVEIARRKKMQQYL